MKYYLFSFLGLIIFFIACSKGGNNNPVNPVDTTHVPTDTTNHADTAKRKISVDIARSMGGDLIRYILLVTGRNPKTAKYDSGSGCTVKFIIPGGINHIVHETDDDQFFFNHAMAVSHTVVDADSSYYPHVDIATAAGLYRIYYQPQIAGDAFGLVGNNRDTALLYQTYSFRQLVNTFPAPN